jgi:DNA invertase Pin-like site-specific DNA recombinase
MPGPRTYKPAHSEQPSPVQFGTLPTARPIAVYYRQSTMAQVGNISTDMQQIDLPRYVMSLGWKQEQIIPIDEDEGVSGAKRIDERKGMSRLFDMILTRRIGAVAVQAEDRLFRDETQIQVNVFLDACVKNDIRVLTPYFKYNFADKHEGPYHRLLFRMRAEQAADFLNSYVRGRLYAAKERMLIQGMWMGGNINLGYMVDNRKTLPSGLPNPNWRKYQPFAPCAEVVVKIFETFVMLGGNQRATLCYVYDNGPHFPDFDSPDLLREVPPGFSLAKPLRMLKRNGVYTVGSVTLSNMLTNAVYLGHWVYKDRVVQWNNHPAIVSEELFYQAFNYLSPYTLDGTPNEQYAPRLGYRHSTKKQQRDAYEPIYVGLVGSYHEGKWLNAITPWAPGMQAYAYTVQYRDDADISHRLWSRRGDYFDKVIDEMLFAKLQATFEPQVWEDVLATAEDDFTMERRLLQHQLSVIEQKMTSLLDNFSYVQSKTLAQALERQFSDYEQEKVRLERKLCDIQQRIDQQESLVELAHQVENVLHQWQELGLMEKRGVAQMFIERIVVTLTAKHRVAEVKIHWHDDSTDTLMLPYRSDIWELWSPEEVERLRQLIQKEAEQVAIAAALPKRNWQAIRIKAYEILGERKFHISPKPIRDEETFADYQVRLERDGNQANRTSGNRWRKDELELLAQVIERGATQLEIAAALPHRSWEAIRKKIVQVHGKGITVPEAGVLAPADTYQDYLEANPETAGAMAFVVLKNSARQKSN